MKTAREIMEKEVHTVQPDMTLRSFAAFLSREGISGAPVLDDEGRLVGVASATDVVRRAADDATLAWAGTDADDGDPDGFFSLDAAGAGGLGWRASGEADPLDDLTVADVMTPATFTVDPDASLREVATFLDRGRIHRALVTEGGRLVGIVTAMDVVRAVAEGAAE